MGDRLAGKVALVTGGARGPGEAECRRFVEAGAKVVIADVNDVGATALVDELGDAATWAHLDVTDADAWGPVVDDVITWGGHLDILINNAGIGAHGLIDELPLERHHRVVD